MDTPQKWRRILTVTLVALGCLLATTSVAIIWLNRFVVDTERYVETVAPLSEDPAIKDAVARRVTDELFSRINANELAREALPERAGFLADPLVGVVNGFTYEQVREFMDSEEFSSIWREANRTAHETVIRVVLGEEGVIGAQGDTIYLDLNTLLDRVKQRLAARGITFFEDVRIEGGGAQFTIFQLPQITQVQQAVSLLNSLALWLPVLALAAWGAALWLSPSRRLALLWAGMGFAIGTAALLLGISAGRSLYLDTIETNGAIDMAAATSFFDIVVSPLREWIRGAFAAGLLVAAAAFVAGPSPFATGLRRAVAKLYGAARETQARIDLGPAGRWIKQQKTFLRGAGLATGLVVIVFISASVRSVALITALLLVYLGAIEFISKKEA